MRQVNKKYVSMYGGGRGEGVSKSRINTSQNGTKLEGSHTVKRKNFTVNWVLILYFCR